MERGKDLNDEEKGPITEDNQQNQGIQSPFGGIKTVLT